MDCLLFFAACLLQPCFRRRDSLWSFTPTLTVENKSKENLEKNLKVNVSLSVFSRRCYLSGIVTILMGKGHYYENH